MSFVSVGLLVLGILLGALVTYAIMLRRNTKLQTELDLTKKARIEEELRLNQIEEQFRDAFQNLAQDILETKARSIAAENTDQLHTLLNPLKERIKEFQEKVEQTHTESMVKIGYLERVGLTMSKEAERLTKALQGEVKTQGDWGEVILERILEESGLREGYEYVLQGVGIDIRNEAGRKIKPDVVIKLPDEKHIIVDSKVSLVSYERYVNTEDVKERETHGRELIRSLKDHIDGLHSRFYQHKPGVNSPDFVVLFMPLEAAYSTALQEDPQLFQYAWDRKIVVTTPTTLMATLWIIANIWQQENQTANALEIARQSGALYDKFVGFVDSLQDIGKHIDRSKDAYDRAFKQLKSGRGNLITRAQSLKEMGVTTKKQLDPELVDEASSDNENLPA
ncbi:MAG: DNA recombination protein RmuC [Firmicutes bacterium]|nr:DNA recombination protein RmuC [Bacillota bacterium]